MTIEFVAAVSLLRADLFGSSDLVLLHAVQPNEQNVSNNRQSIGVVFIVSKEPARLDITSDT